MPKLLSPNLMPAALVLLGDLLLASAAFAQGAATPAPVPERPPTATAPENRVPEQVAPTMPQSGAEVTQPGVVSPRRNMDPGMTVTPPAVDSGTTRVIPPPGTPGGDQRVQPR